MERPSKTGCAEDQLLVTSATDASGPRLPLLKPADLDPDQQALYQRFLTENLPISEQQGIAFESSQGELFGPFNAWLYSPKLSDPQSNYFEAEARYSSLNPRVRQVVILTVGAVCRNAFELYAHSIQATNIGLSADAIYAVATGQHLGPETGLTAQEIIAHRFTRAVTESYRAPDELFAEAKDSFGYVGLVDMMHLAGIYQNVATMLNAFNVPVPA